METPNMHLGPTAAPATPVSPLGVRPPLGPPTLGPRPFIGPPPGGLVEPLPARRREIAANATLVSRLDLTPSIARFVVRPDAGVPAFKPGQYFALGLVVDGALLQRPYSTASAAGATEEVEFLVRRVGSGSFTPHLWDAADGTRVWLGPPKGLFTLQPDDRRTHLFISTGTGLAPFISMSEALMNGSDPGEGAPSRPGIVVVHGASYATELAYRDRLDDWAASSRLLYVPTVSRPDDPANAGWTGAVGRTEAILDSVCDRLALLPDSTVAYICGNPEMVEAATATLRRRGFAAPAIIRENYWTITDPGR